MEEIHWHYDIVAYEKTAEDGTRLDGIVEIKILVADSEEDAVEKAKTKTTLRRGGD